MTTGITNMLNLAYVVSLLPLENILVLLPDTVATPEEIRGATFKYEQKNQSDKWNGYESVSTDRVYDDESIVKAESYCMSKKN